MFHKIAVVALATLGMPAVANAMPQTQDEWFVDSGRYLNGQIVSYGQAPASYNQAPAYKHVVAYAGKRATRIIEGRSSAYVPVGHYEGLEHSPSSREQMIHAF